MKSTLLMIVSAVAAFAVVFAVTRVWNAPRDERHARETAASRPTIGPPVATVPGMVWIPSGEFTMGTDLELGWTDEKPAHRVRVDGFLMDEAEVTNAQFLAFVAATKYVTTAERVPTVEDILAQSPPGTPAPPKEILVAGSLVFTMTDGPVALNDFSPWWKWTPAANWKHPEGPSLTRGRDEFTYFPGLVRIPEVAAPDTKNKS